MAENTSFDASKFEKKRDEILTMEKDTEWKLAKQFEHTEMYRRSDNDSVFKVIYNVTNTHHIVNLRTVRPPHDRYP